MRRVCPEYKGQEQHKTLQMGEQGPACHKLGQQGGNKLDLRMVRDLKRSCRRAARSAAEVHQLSQVSRDGLTFCISLGIQAGSASHLASW